VGNLEVAGVDLPRLPDDPLHKNPGVHPQRPAEFGDRVRTGNLQPPLKLTDLGAMKRCSVADLLLGVKR
jgi:hypothetical protein